MAVGIGAYGEFNRGYETFGQNLGGDFKGNNDYTGGNGGIIIDTAAAKNTMLNYRLRIGGGKISFPTKAMTDISMIHTLGVSPDGLRSEHVRFWFGPRIGLHYQFNSYTIKDNSALYFAFLMPPNYAPMFFLMQNQEKIKLDMFKGDIGLVFAGFNFNFGDSFTMSVELGFDYGFKIGNYKSSSISTPGKLYGEGIEGFGTFSCMFRIHDTFTGDKGAVKTDIMLK